MTNEELRLYVETVLYVEFNTDPDLVAVCMAEYDLYKPYTIAAGVCPKVRVVHPLKSKHLSIVEDGAGKAAAELELYGRWFVFKTRWIKP